HHHRRPPDRPIPRQRRPMARHRHHRRPPGRTHHHPPSPGHRHQTRHRVSHTATYSWPVTEPTDHYFTNAPAASEAERRQLHTHLAGHDATVETASGIFSPGGLDKATAILLDEVPQPPSSGDLLDLGCGWGPIAL